MINLNSTRLANLKIHSRIKKKIFTIILSYPPQNTLKYGMVLKHKLHDL